MTKYSFEFKKQVVKAYLDREGGYKYLATKFGISTESLVKLWISKYHEYGEEGLSLKKQNSIYSFDFKLSVVKYYLTNEISYKDLAIQHKISQPATIASWVSKFRKDGAGGLSNKKGRPPKMKFENKTKILKENTDAKEGPSTRINELEQQVLALQIENAYLKELRRLRLEETRKKK